MTGTASFSKYCVHRRHWSAGVRNVIPPYRHSHEPQYRDQWQAEADDGSPYTPGGPSLEVMEVVPLSEALSCAYASRHRFSTAAPPPREWRPSPAVHRRVECGQKASHAG